MFLHRSFLFASALVGTLALHAQFTDDFGDGDFTNNPAWEGDASVFIVNGDGQLQLNNSVAGTSQLRSANTMASLNDMEWRMRVKLGFAPSSSNFARVYLVSDQADLNGPLNGYFLQFGEAGSADAIELFEQTGTDLGSVCRGTDAEIAGAFDVGVQVKRSAAGVWQLWVDPTGGTNYALQATGSGTAHGSSSTIGVLCTYTVSNADSFFFDDLYAGPAIVDLSPPAILDVTAISATSVDVRYTEALAPGAIGSYDILPFIGVASALLDGVDPSIVHLSPTTALTNGSTYTLLSDGAQDGAGNTAGLVNTEFTYFVPLSAEPREVVINELMADPTPAVGLPEVEFVELHNTTTTKTFDLADWTFSDGGTPVALPSYLLGPGEYVVLLANTNLGAYGSLPNKLGLSSLPALNNDGDALALRDNTDALIDAVTYSLDWYRDAVKDDGGWTLEQIDPTAPCAGSGNWRASNAAAGGTPGAQNSVYAIVPDVIAPVITGVTVSNATSVGVTFNETMDQGSVQNATYTLSPAIAVSSVLASTTSAQLQLVAELVVGTVYTLSISGATDCAGNAIGSNSIVFARPEPVEPGDVVINEVLYDPVVGGSDMVELYNRSNKTLSLAGWQLANESEGEIDDIIPINSALLLLPGTYALITEDVAGTLALYPQSAADRVVGSDMPSYNNDEGVVVLLALDGTSLDRFAYSDDLHFTLVNNPEGYTLERVDPDRPSDDNTNWQTASDVAGKATPGFRNSQYAETPAASGELNIDPAIFSPDNDGFQDVLTLAYRFEQPGFVGTMSIFDIVGREVRRLLDNQLLGTEGAVSWNGITDEGDKARMGPYIVLMEVYDLKGNVEKYKRTVTLAHRLER